jgi:hypothetical protein
MEIPKQFKFKTIASSLEYQATEVPNGNFIVKWFNGSVGYKRDEVIECLKEGIWIIDNSEPQLKILFQKIERLEKGIEKAIYNLANEDISDEFVVDQIRMDLVNLIKS